MADIGQEQLTKLYKQPTDQYGSYDANAKNATALEVWKGNMSAVMTLYGKIKNWQPTGEFDTYTYADFVRDAGADQLDYTYGSTLSSNASLVTAELTEVAAGDNAELRLTWGQSTINVDPTTEDPVYDTKWQLQWQSQSYSLYAYCGYLDDGHQNPDPDTSENMRQKKASRNAIENWFNLSLQYQNIKDNNYFVQGAVVNQKLNHAEEQIVAKIRSGKTSPIFHYPILTKIQTTECPDDKIDATLAKSSSYFFAPDQIWLLDIAPNKPPFEIPLPPGMPAGQDKWSWLCQGTNMNVSINPKTHKATIQLSTPFWGAAGVWDKDNAPGFGWDKNFYGDGDDRWLFGQA